MPCDLHMGPAGYRSSGPANARTQLSSEEARSGHRTRGLRPSGVMRPCGTTPVASINVNPGPREKIPPTPACKNKSQSRGVYTYSATYATPSERHCLLSTGTKETTGGKVKACLHSAELQNPRAFERRTKIRLWNSKPRILRGWNSLGIRVPSG